MNVDSAFGVIDKVLKSALDKLNHDARQKGFTGIRRGKSGPFVEPYSLVKHSKHESEINICQPQKKDVSGLRFQFSEMNMSVQVFELRGSNLKKLIDEMPLADMTEARIRDVINPYLT